MLYSIAIRIYSVILCPVIHKKSVVEYGIVYVGID